MVNITGEMHHLLKVISWLYQCTQEHIHRCLTYRHAHAGMDTVMLMHTGCDSTASCTTVLFLTRLQVLLQSGFI